MENLTELIASEIKKQYKSVRRFAMHMNIPQTTLFSVLKNGINGTAYETVVRICKELNIKLVNYDSSVMIDDDVLDLIKKYNFLDELGVHTVRAIINTEFDRCSKQPAFTRLASFGGKNAGSISSSSPDVHDAFMNVRNK